jgi:GTP1/Obg family GTP-binding protein
MDEQMNLLEEVSGLISERPILVVHSKLDLYQSTEMENKLAISSITGEGMELLRQRLVEMIAADDISDPLTLPEDWPRNDLS